MVKQQQRPLSTQGRLLSTIWQATLRSDTVQLNTREKIE